eukprot:Nitzschia sp. Nitz4//scaffold133_size116822//78899//79345//NITZ4_003813-RA/size116822-exonerate_est2genome-gene-0.138-mRNA-1//-1//CDS//3329535414//1611//frame0
MLTSLIQLLLVAVAALALSDGDQAIHREENPYAFVRRDLSDTITLDLSAYPSGTVITDQFIDSGVIVSASPGDAVIVDLFGTFKLQPSDVNGVIELNFVEPGTTTPTTVTGLSFVATTGLPGGVTVTYFTPEGYQIYSHSNLFYGPGTM